MKNIVTIILILFSLQGIGQTTKIFNTTYPNGLFGRKDTQTVTALNNTINEYLTSFGTWGKLPDSVRTFFSATSPIFYNSSTGVISSQQFTSTLNGYVPLSGGGSTNFLRADGSWATPAGTATGTVTSIATTSPITGGTITSTGTIACATCVVAAVNPSVGVLHVAGSTQTATGSLIVNADITNATIDLTTKVTGALPVANGGTANTSFTAYSLIAAGTTSTGAFQNVSGVGTSGQILTSNGAGALPTWQAASGGSGWALTGNASITPVTNFLGTTDAKSLRINTNGVTRIVVDSVTFRTYIDSIPIWRGAITSTGGNINDIAIGDSALFRQTTGTENTALGYYALSRDSTGGGNTAVGYQALKVLKRGVNNTAIGDQALAGLGALSATANADYNTAIGYAALNGMTTATRNIGIGYQAGLVSNANDNVWIGYQAGLANSSGTESVGIGYQALKAVTSNSYNTAVGYGVLSTATGQRNTGIGDRALGGVTSGSGNIGVGEDAFYQVSTGTDNIRIGREDTKTTGITTGSYNVIIGTNVGLVSATALSNTIILADGQGTMRHYINSSGQHGLNYTSPTSTLQIAPTTATTAGLAPLKFTYFNIATTNATQSSTTVTLTFATQTAIPFTVGSSIVVAGITPSGYNGTFTVLSSTTTTVTYSTTAGLTGQTVAGTITQGGNLLASPEVGAVEYDATNLYLTNNTATRYTLDKILTNSAALDFASLVAIGCEDLTITVTGAADGDPVELGVPNGSVVANSSYSAWVSSSNTVTVRFCALVSGDPASGTFKVAVSKY